MDIVHPPVDAVQATARLVAVVWTKPGESPLTLTFMFAAPGCMGISPLGISLGVWPADVGGVPEGAAPVVPFEQAAATRTKAPISGTTRHVDRR